MLRRLWPVSFALTTLVALSATLVGISTSTADEDVEQMWGKAAAKYQVSKEKKLGISPDAVIGEAAKANAYDRLFTKPLPYWRSANDRNTGRGVRELSWEELAASPHVKGVLFARPPSGSDKEEKVKQPLVIESFESEFVAGDANTPARVKLTFKVAGADKPQTLNVSAAVLAPMSIAATKRHRVLFTALESVEKTDKGEETVKIESGIHPALEYHRLAFRAAVLDGFAFTGDRMSLVSLRNMIDARRKHAQLASVLIERPWSLDASALALPKFDGDVENAIVEYKVRPVPEKGKEDEPFEPLDLSARLNQDVFKSLTETERQLMREMQEAVIVGRIVYGAQNGWFALPDKGKGWLKMLEHKDLIANYEANLSKSLTADELYKEMKNWDKEYKDAKTDQKLSDEFRLK